MKVTALIGNGISIAYNQELSCGSLTNGLLADLNSPGGSGSVSKFLSDLAEQLGGSAHDFEGLLGPLDLLGESLTTMHGLVSASTTLVAGEDQRVLSEAFMTVKRVANRIYRRGAGQVLKLIEDRSVGAGEFDIVTNLVRSLAYLADDGLTLATLNYDCLVLAASLDQFKKEMYDLALGYDNSTYELVDGVTLPGRRLRDSDNIPSGPCKFISLHGSLTWFRRGDEIVKFRVSDLRKVPDFWEAYLQGTTDWTPAVVLTNQAAKSRRIKESPFNLAYEIFSGSLIKDQHWMIGGYSFGDACVNEALRDAIRIRRGAVRCLVVTRPDGPSDATIASVLDGCDVFTLRSGFTRMRDTAEWRDWIS